MAVIVTAVPPTFASTTGVAGLVVFSNCVPKVTEAGERPTAVPTPCNETKCGLLGSESTNVRVPVRVPAAVGLNPTLT